MNLIYTKDKTPVNVGDKVEIDGQLLEIKFFSKPHKASSSGKITVAPVGTEEFGNDREFYVNIIGAEWINREDQ